MSRDRSGDVPNTAIQTRNLPNRPIAITNGYLAGTVTAPRDFSSDSTLSNRLKGISFAVAREHDAAAAIGDQGYALAKEALKVAEERRAQAVSPPAPAIGLAPSHDHSWLHK